jgi:ABC-2 type transport system ATP-binding protein
MAAERARSRRAGGTPGTGAKGTGPSQAAERGPTTLRVTGLRKRFGNREALVGVDLEAHWGELIAVLGPNGAGKTTLLSIIAGIAPADGGEVEVERDEVGWVPQQAGLYRRLTVAENLRLFARLEGVGDLDGAVDEMLSQTGLAERRDDQIASLSGGNQQRINIAIGLLARPSVLLLDEPSAGLDPRQRVRLWEFVSALAAAGTTVIYSTHQIDEASRYGDRLVVLADGESLFDGTFAELRRAAGSGPEGAPTDAESEFVRFLESRSR